MTTSARLITGGASGWTYEHDILGNRIRRNASITNHAHPMRYDWDVLNRATLIAQPSGGAGYAYRADGQRIEKVEGITFSWSGSRESGQYDTNYAQNRPTSRYYYDWQMGFEDDYNPSGTITKVTRNVLGARGIDRISITENSATTHGYPLYDGHGNCRAILTKNGTSYGTGNWRTYDVWGSVRSGSATGDPKSRYVASIGHVADDESSLIYMRARYYEPATGRFVSEDPAMDGANWYVYCGSDSVNRLDVTGKEHVPEFTKLLIQNLINIAIAGALYTFGRELYDQYAAGGEFNILRLTLKLVKGGVMAALGVAYFAALEVGLTAAAANGFALAEVAAYATYALFITAFIVLMDVALDSLVDSLAPWNR